MRPYKLGLIVGRFQMLHLGHVDMISKALDICERVILFVGSAQESRTAKNPLTFDERKKMLSKTFPNNLLILPLPDAGIGNNEKWGDYILSQIPSEYGTPDIAISGRESRRSTWFDNQNIAELFVAKKIEISATEMRDFLKNDNKFTWMEYSPCEIQNMYKKLRKIILDTQNVNTTESI